MSAGAAMKFAKVPLEVLRDKRITFRQMKSLISILSFGLQVGDVVWPSLEAIAQRAGMLPTHVSQATRELVELGWLVKEGKGGFRMTTRYRVVIPNLETLPESGNQVGGETLPESGNQVGTPTLPESGKSTLPESGKSTLPESGNPIERDQGRDQRRDQTPMVREGRFDEFWQAYPKKAGKLPASKKWTQKKLDGKADLILADIRERTGSDRKWLEGYIPNPLTYLTQERWDDEIDRRPAGRSATESRQQDHLQRVRQQLGLDAGVNSRVIEGDFNGGF
jgi:hypothetical protein